MRQAVGCLAQARFSSSLESAQIVSRHLFRFIDSEHPQHRRRNIPQRAVGLQCVLLRIFRDNDKWNRIRGVSRVRTSGRRINHHLGVAVISGDEHGSALGANRGFDAAEAGIYRFDRLHCGFDFS